MIKRHITLLLGAALIYGCSSDDDTLINNDAATLGWNTCESISSLQCAELTVPMDYSDAEGEKITLALIRKQATGTQRKGSLLFNPGGPGGSGVEIVKILHQIDSIPESVLASYDIVGFDPRGIGASTPVDCTQFGLEDFNQYPQTAQEVRELHADVSAFGAACTDKYGAYLQQLGSINVVRDMDKIRQALGDNKLNFIGYSYGTRLAALYLQEFPATSGRIVLDASLPPESSVKFLMQDSLPTMHENLRNMLAQCSQFATQCDVDELLSRMQTRIVQLTSDPSEEAGEELDFFGEVIFAAIEDPLFANVAAEYVIDYVNSYDRTVLEEFLVFLENMGFNDDDEEGAEESEDDETAEIAVLCADDAERPTADSLITLLGELNQVSDVLAEVVVSRVAGCAGWPEALEPLAPIATGTAPLSLVIGGTSDAQTPLRWSQAMAQAIGGTYIRSEHSGHTAVFTDESDCLDNMVEQFLIDGLAPATVECR